MVTWIVFKTVIIPQRWVEALGPQSMLHPLLVTDPPGPAATDLPKQGIQLAPSCGHCSHHPCIGQCSCHLCANHTGYLWSDWLVPSRPRLPSTMGLGPQIDSDSCLSCLSIRVHFSPQSHLHPPQCFLPPNCAI